jgi:transposase
LSDRQAADAVRGRIDWKYALCLPLEDAGFDASVLSEFRARLIAKNAETLLFETLLAALKEAKLVKPRSRQRTDATHVLAAIQVLNRLELVGETMRHALNTLATVVPAWLQGLVPTGWFARYARRFEEYRLPDALAERTALAEQIGDDGRQLLGAIFARDEYARLAQVPAVETLRRVWVQQFHAGAPLRWREAKWTDSQ